MNESKPDLVALLAADRLLGCIAEGFATNGIPANGILYVVTTHDSYPEEWVGSYGKWTDATAAAGQLEMPIITAYRHSGQIIEHYDKGDFVQPAEVLTVN